MLTTNLTNLFSSIVQLYNHEIKDTPMGQHIFMKMRVHLQNKLKIDKNELKR